MPRKKQGPAEGHSGSITDPVSGYTYPGEWVAACPDTAALDRVRQGLAVLASDGTVLVRGFSTGTTASAAAKAAVLSLARPVGMVRVVTASSVPVRIPVRGRDGIASCTKDPGDHPSDITRGLAITAEAAIRQEGCVIGFGEGVGRFARTTPRYRNGDPAVSPPATACIAQAVSEACLEAGLPGVEVTIRIPEGSAVAKRTLNECVGVFGGLSILGTTGFVEPWDDHLDESVWDRISSHDRVVLTTGRIGLKYSRLLFPGHEVVLVGSRIGEALERSPAGTVLCGLPGLILRFIDPDICSGTPYGTVEELMADAACGQRADSGLQQYRERYPNVSVVLLDRSGNITGRSP